MTRESLLKRCENANRCEQVHDLSKGRPVLPRAARDGHRAGHAAHERAEHVGFNCKNPEDAPGGRAVRRRARAPEEVSVGGGED